VIARASGVVSDRGIEAGREMNSGSPADDLWRRLNSVDFMNQAMTLAATLLLCAVPFLIIVSALAGRSAAGELGRRLGLNHQAAGAIGHLFASSAVTSRAVTGAAWVFFILGGGRAGPRTRTSAAYRAGTAMVRRLTWRTDCRWHRSSH
jgi:hypothetical protein